MVRVRYGHGAGIGYNMHAEVQPEKQCALVIAGPPDATGTHPTCKVCQSHGKK